jgi:ATP-dependent helicase/nuclease subunit A
MSRQLQSPMPAHIVEAQRRASDPRHSVWVSANAGSGKTYVLTERVVRLLLSGVRPEDLLCLTYTKAAAAEMRRRVSKRLGDWAVLPEAALLRELEDMIGIGPDAETRTRARTLFAHALETPGGLRINTIHAFCESVLHRFPLEAGVPFEFTVIEDSEAQELIRRARESVLAEGIAGTGPIADAVDVLFEEMSDFSLTDAIDEALAAGRKLRPVLADIAAAKAKLRAHLGLPAATSLVEAKRRLAAGTHLLPGDYDQIAGGVGRDTPSIDALIAVFLTAKFEPRKALLTKAESAKNPERAVRLERERDRVFDAYLELNALTLVARSEAMLDILDAVSRRYAEQKRRRALVDFDDLVERLGDLFANRAYADWVKYKLDAGITHILVDEGQDTNPEQWRVVGEIVEEFFAGDSAAQRHRTYFGVGDEKQSIYSFQGADPRLFQEISRRFRRLADQSAQPATNVSLNTSFRTLPGILAAVDTVFRAGEQHAALLMDAPVLHESARAEAGGTVTVWAPFEEAEAPAGTGEWPLVPTQNLASAPRRLAEFIAREIQHWIETRRPLGPRGRAVRPGDVLILVQKRSALFSELIRALAQEGVPTPGLDLLALADVLLNPADDLQLAALLRSPLFDVTEDELLEIGAKRPSTLWAALEASDLVSARDAFDRLHRWRGRLDFDRPFEFYAEMLYRGGGLKRLHTRLGEEIDDVVAEFLDLALAHEQSNCPSLQGFVAEMRARAVSVKRDLAEATHGVRVMTVHGAKGLEAPIVILADAASRPAWGQTRKSIFIVPDGPGPLLVHAGRKSDHTPETAAFESAAQAAEAEEYWRRLYVGMTRAEDELYIAGALTSRGKVDGTWHAAIQAALDADCEPLADAEGKPGGFIFPRRRPLMLPSRLAEALPASPVATDDFSSLRRPEMVPLITPSTAAAPLAEDHAFKTALETVADAEAARAAGTVLHVLLQHLPGVPRDERRRVAEKSLATLLPEAPEQHAGLAEKALAILANPAFAALFGTDSRGEVPFLLNAKRDGRPVRLAGRIDRLVVAKGRVLVVDYKSDANPPQSVSGVSASYLIQVGLYAYVASQLFPGQVVETGILWTSLESLMILPPAALRDAVSSFTKW